MSLEDTFRIMQAKSYLRTSIPRAIEKLQKTSKFSVSFYYQAKFGISMIKFHKSASDSNFQKIFGLLQEFSLQTGIGALYQIKVLYLQAELSFMTKNYQYFLHRLSYKHLLKAEDLCSLIKSKYLNNPKRALNTELVRQRINQS